MASTKGTILDNTRKRLGSLVYSANGSGNYVKFYKKPTNPNSIAQQNQRNRFRAMSGGYGALTQIIQQGWANFAASIYNPLKKTNKGQLSAIMAFKGIKLTIQGNNDRTLVFTGTYDSLTPSVTLTSLAIAMPATAPINTVRPDILNGSGSNLPLDISGATITGAGACTCSIVFSGAPSAGITGTTFTDENGTQYGFTFYISDPVHSIGYRPRNPYFQNIGFTKIITAATPTPATHSKINLSWNCSTLIPTYKRFPLTGQIVLLTCCVVGSNGTIAHVGSQYVTLT